MIWHEFQRPSQVQSDDEERSDSFGRFLAQPFERGWGTTVGNALRRALLSSIPGGAITAVKIEGADHEFSAVPGVVEDVTDIILNLKKIPFRVHGQEPIIMSLDAQGPGEVTAGQLEGSHAVEVIDPNVHIATLSADGELQMTVRVARGRGYIPAEENQTPDLELAHLSDKGKLEMTLTIGRGRGYVPAELNRGPEHTIGVIPIDSAGFVPARAGARNRAA